ncbi:TetR/AcrR family transcriptional regulator [Herbaspirillum sp. YR522]|uniref:TetR/AcrR family transcriptional regulator n=1 Tax=Herbaspirillum sp. YR522 TaxID=1144342 RepID=UPI00026F4A3B|nr:TetR/AcrR family transcriptional regulator [Herbaspirillum sp. YR522]EJN10305.1 transcriptional regulator [Herbaspirillum sp. YR522]
MQSHKTEASRRVPKQERAEHRIRQMLATTEKLISKRGLEAVTMTEIAAVAGMSIGALYQYFPNKDAIASAMRTAYAQEMDRLWSGFLALHETLDLRAFSDGIVDLMTAFIAAHPAYLVLFSSDVKATRTDAQREGLRLRFAQAFMQRCPALAKDQAMHIASIAVAMVKSLVGAREQAAPADRPHLEAEMKIALLAYLSVRLDDE